VTTIREMAASLGVAFVSFTEALDLSTPSGRALAGMLAVFAEFERDLIRERVRGGLERARRDGTRLGRPPTAATATHVKEARELRALELSHAEIARRLGIGESSVRRILAAAKSSRRPRRRLP
jgi:putative DNA-invertase from lambdoid prophage Rac